MFCSNSDNENLELGVAIRGQILATIGREAEGQILSFERATRICRISELEEQRVFFLGYKATSVPLVESSIGRSSLLIIYSKL